MQFTQIPPDYSPLGGEIRYTVTTETAETICIRIEDQYGNLHGTKRFVDVLSAEFDAAPYMRHALNFKPSFQSTGFQSSIGRTVKAVVSAETPSGKKATAESRTLIPSVAAEPSPKLVTKLPRERLIAEGECDELTLRGEGPFSVTVTAQAGDTTTAQSYTSVRSGFYVFRLDTSDFPAAESITVDAGPCGKVVYTVLGPQQGARRLAWRSSVGSIEHYTFPVVLTQTLEAGKKRAYGPDGHTTSAVQVQRTALCSAYEVQPVLEALAEIILSPSVWLAEGNVYTPIDVVTEQAVVRRHGTMSCLELEIQPKRKTTLPWN